MRKATLISILAWAFTFGAQAVYAVDTQNQSWIIFEQGNAAFSAKEFGRALQLFKNAITSAGIFPEAELALGDVYLEEGETDLAIRQYNKAYDMRKSFYIPDAQYEALYKLAKVYKLQQQYGQMVQTLRAVISDDKHFNETPTFQLKSQIVGNYKEKGLDHVLMLYVFDDQFAASAHSTLGWYYYRTGQQADAIKELLFSLISRTTEVVSFLHGQDVDFEFSNLSDLLAAALKSKDAAAFIKEVDFFQDLYYLGCATYSSGLPQSAAVLWKMVAGTPAAGNYQDLAKRQLKKPWTEPVLMPEPPQ